MSILIIVVTVFLGVSGVVLLAAARKKVLFMAFAVVACIPLVLGAIGTAMGYAKVRVAEREPQAMRSPDAMNMQLARARIPLYMGAGGFGALLMVSLAGLLLCKEMCPRKDKESRIQDAL